MQMRQKNNHRKNHAAVSEIISTLLLLSISVVGASLLAIFINDSFESGSIGQTQDSPAKVFELRSFDTRDSAKLMNIPNLNNQFDSKLCASSCQSETNHIPSNNGTEFFVIQIENKSPVSVFLDKIYLNNISYRWDSLTSGVSLDTTSDDVDGGSYPLDGKFSILSSNSDLTQLDKQIPSGKIVNILFKLGGDSENILLNKSMMLRISTGDLNSKEFLIQSGGAQ